MMALLKFDLEHNQINHVVPEKRGTYSVNIIAKFAIKKAVVEIIGLELQSRRNERFANDF